MPRIIHKQGNPSQNGFRSSNTRSRDLVPGLTFGPVPRSTSEQEVCRRANRAVCTIKGMWSGDLSADRVVEHDNARGVAPPNGTSAAVLTHFRDTIRERMKLRPTNLKMRRTEPSALPGKGESTAEVLRSNELNCKEQPQSAHLPTQVSSSVCTVWWHPWLSLGAGESHVHRTSLRNAKFCLPAPPGQAWPGQDMRGQALHGLSGPGLACPGLACPGQAMPVLAWPGLAWSGQAWPLARLVLARPGQHVMKN